MNPLPPSIAFEPLRALSRFSRALLWEAIRFYLLFCPRELLSPLSQSSTEPGSLLRKDQTLLRLSSLIDSVLIDTRSINHQ